MKRPFLIGITGGTGTGKTTFAKMLSQEFPGKVLLIQQDMYYKDLSLISPSKRRKRNFDTPSAFENNLLISHLKKLIKGEKVKQPLYDFSTQTREKEKRTLKPLEITIVEGILILATKALRELFDLKIYMEAGEGKKRKRRIKRDTLEKRYLTKKEALKQYLTKAKPNFKIYVAPQKKWADIIVNWNYTNKKAVERVAAVIKEQA